MLLLLPVSIRLLLLNILILRPNRRLLLVGCVQAGELEAGAALCLQVQEGE